MNGRIAIYCNGMVPGTGVPSGAQGLRANGLRLGLAAHGFDAEIVSSAATVHSHMKRWGVARVRIPGWFRVLQNDVCLDRLKADYRAVILLNWAGLPDFRKGDKQTLVYDFFSPTMVEHSFIAEAEELARRRAKKDEVLRQADIFVANGTGRADYARTYLREQGIDDAPEVFSVRLALPWAGTERRPERPLRIFFGGFDQAWTRGLDGTRLEALATATGAELHVIGAGQHLHHGNAEPPPKPGRSKRNSMLVSYPVMPFEDFAAVNGRCDLALDVFEPNEERRLSYSTRAISSLACGCPVVTMSFTEIGNLIQQTGAGWTLDTFEAGELSALLSDIAKNRELLAERQLATRRFWERYINPETEIRELVGALS